MIKDSVGASIEKVTVCINDTALTSIMDKIIEKVSLSEYFIDIEDQVKDELEDYLNGIQSFGCTKSISVAHKKCLQMVNANEELIKTFINSIDKDFTLSKYLKIKLQTREQHRAGVYDSTSDKKAKNSILFECDIAKYKEHTNRDSGIEDILTLIKMLLFVDINKIFPYIFSGSDISKIDLWDGISQQIDESIVTSFKLTDTLNSADLLYEDYFYELGQLEMDSFSKIKKINYKNQKITFRIDSFKQYGELKTPEEVEDEIFDKAVAQREKEISVLEADEDEDDFAELMIAASEHNVDIDVGLNSGIEETLPSIASYIEHELKLREKKLEKTCTIDTVIVFLKDESCKKGKRIKIDFQVQGAQNIYKLLFPVEAELENIDNERIKKISQEIIPIISEQVQEIFNNGLYSFFMNMPATDNNFEGIKTPYYTPSLNFIKKDVVDAGKKKQDGIISKIILAILMYHRNLAFRNWVLNFFERKQRKELEEFHSKLSSKIYNYNKKENAIISLFKYFGGNVDAQ